MACSGRTSNLSLPQYEGKDHPDFLAEINEAYRKLDTVIGELQDAIGEIKGRLDILEN